jgi:hypothetical protein
MGVTAAVAAITAIGTGASIENSKQTRRLAGQAEVGARAGVDQANRKAESDAERASIGAAQDAARVRQKGVKSDRAGTILSAPTGATGYSGTATLGGGSGKTLLGQ